MCYGPESMHEKNHTPAPAGQLADVLLPLRLPHPFTYHVSPEQKVQEGTFVRVPLGRRQETGVVWHLHRPDSAQAAGNRQQHDSADAPGTSTPRQPRLKTIAEVLGHISPLPAVQRRLIDWMARYYVASPGLVLKLFMAAPLALRPSRPRIGWQALMDEASARAAGHRITPQRARVLQLLTQASTPIATDELLQQAGISRSVLQGMADAGLLKPVALPAEEHTNWPRPQPADFCPPTLNDEQRHAADALRQALQAGGFSVHLLDGITGSGKTEVYFEAIEQALINGRQALLLLPEIALTDGFIQRLQRRFGFTPAQWHSDLGAAQRARIWRGVASGDVRLVVAARSGLFLPWRSLGLIVVDEEHESAYKQDTTVPYQGRDVAVMLGKLGDFPVVLASATPSLESIVNAERGRYTHLRLRRRHGPARLPQMALIDMRAEKLPPRHWLATPLVEAVNETLQRNEQALLFLNRRGYAPLTLCRACGHRLQCPHCATWLVQHRHATPPRAGRHGNTTHDEAAHASGEILLCHHCGHTTPLPATCPSCGAEGRLAPVGPGVERLAEEAAARWPDARVLALSSDLWQGEALKQRMREIAAGEHDIIIGTQLVAKGHHFPLLTTVGVVDADLALETADPRAGERTWQLLAQVAGRAGRAERPGRALIQTHLPDTPLMQALAAADRDAFLQQEKQARKAAGMPPFGRLAAIVVSAEQEEEVHAFCMALARHRPASQLVSVLGPAPAPITRLRNRWRWRFLLKAPRRADLQGYIRAWLGSVKQPARIRVEIDIDPYNFL